MRSRKRRTIWAKFARALFFEGNLAVIKTESEEMPIYKSAMQRLIAGM